MIHKNVALVHRPLLKEFYPAGMLGLGLSAWPDDWTPAQAKIHADAIATILAACRRHGVAPGIHTGDGVTARGYLDQGFLMVTVASDLGLITGGGRTQLDLARGVA